MPPVPLTMPVLGIYGADDSFCLEGQMLASRNAVQEGCWHCCKLPNVGHWIQLQAADRVTDLLLAFVADGSVTA